MTPDEQERLYFQGLTHLAEGRYAEGWPLYELRRLGEGPVMDPLRTWPGLGCPEWRGEDVAGRHLIVFGEQGFGDQIQFARFVPMLQARGASVTYVCTAELARLFPFGHVMRRRQDFPPAHYWAMVGSLPFRLGVTLETLPPPVAITAPGALSGAGGVGVVTRGRPAHPNDADRSLAGEAARELLALGRDLHPEATGARDFLETARLVANLDLVICVDTSIAHLAASMGKPVWLLLPAKATDWRWMRRRPDTPWYPSMRLFRQATPGDWRPVLDAVRAALGNVVPALAREV